MNNPRPFLIGEKWVHTSVSEPVRNPFDQHLIAEVCQAGLQEMNDVMECASKAYGVMRRLPAHARSCALGQMAASLRNRKEEFSRTICLEAGKPIRDARREVERAIQTFQLAGEEAKRIPGEVIPFDGSPGMEGHVGILNRFPIGPVLGITPFNFPLNLVAHKVAPCLAAGNSIVIKPAPQAPLSALLLGEIFLETDLPPGALNIIPCSNVVAEALVQQAHFQALSFTGSAAVGWMLKGKSGKKRVLLELGGNAGVIVEPDADIDGAVQRCATGGFSYSGQTCISVQRIFVQETVYETFLEKLVARVRELPMGDPLQEETVIGPLISEQAAQRVEQWIQEADQQGAHIHIGGSRAGSMVVPTVLTDVTNRMNVSCCEIFGPVVMVTPYGSFEDALTQLNDSAFGLQAGVFTQDVRKIFQAYQELTMGAVLANEIPTFRADHMPYGGTKDSGLGREGVRYAIQEMTDPKLLVLTIPQ